KKSYQRILTFLAETREYVAGELRNGDRPTGQQIAGHLRSAFAALPEGVEKIYARAAATRIGSSSPACKIPSIWRSGLMLFNRETDVGIEKMRHTTPRTARLRFLFVAAKIWRHAGSTGIS
ncbi:MAG: hypothetical protein ACR2I2_00550, partial [Bryobacteraceae bacterium]